jgi:hypothetical protein
MGTHTSCWEPRAWSVSVPHGTCGCRTTMGIVWGQGIVKGLGDTLDLAESLEPYDTEPFLFRDEICVKNRPRSRTYSESQ